MPNTYNLYNLEAPFKQFLLAGNQKAVSIKNYLSDVRHFFGWLILYFKSHKIQIESEVTITQFITTSVISEYKSYLESNNIPHKTTNRRLSTLRKFCSFCISQGWMKENPAKKISNISSLPPTTYPLQPNKASVSPGLFKKAMAFIGRWKIGMEAGQEDRSKIPFPIPPSISNFGLQHYIGLIIILIFVSVMGAGIYNQFFVKVREQFAYPTALTRAGRILSFQGRLTDTLSNPITTATNVTFKLYSVSTGGTALYNTGACSVTPDGDGIFSSLIGSDCGAEIGNAIFTENTNIYLGVTVASDAEMTPRQQIANVGYAINSETLQGLPPGTGTSVIPYINVDGNLLIAAASPGIRSTYTSTDFTLSSAKAAVIQAAGTGDVILQATESGTLKFRTGGATDTYTRITVDNAGLVGIGTTNPGQQLELTGDLKVGGDDIFMGTNTSGMLLVADGTNFNPVAMSGDITIDGTGATAIGTDKVVEADLKVVDAAVDEECLTYETTTGDFEWQTCGGGVTADSLDFIDFEDTLDLDANLILNQAAYTWVQNFTGDTTVGLTYNANSLTTGTALALSSTATTFNGELLTLSKTGASGSTAFTSDIANVAYSQTFNGGVGLDSTGNVLDLSRAITLNNVGNTHTVSGAGVTVSDSGTQTAGTLTWTGDTMRVAQNYTGANSSALNITTASTDAGTSNFALRVNDDGTFTDSTPFVVDESGNVGIGTTTPQTTLNILKTSAGAETSPLLLTNLSATDGTAVAIDFSSYSDGSLLTGQITNKREAGADYSLIFGTYGNFDAMSLRSGKVGIGTTNPGMKLDLGTDYLTTNSTFRTGTFELQPYALNNSFLAENAYYNGSWTRRNTGYAEGFQFYNGQTLFFNNTSGTGTFTATYPFKTDSANSGSVALGGNINVTTGNYSGATMVVLGSGNVGIGTTAPGSALDVKGTLRLSGATSGYVGLAPAAAAGSTTYTLPAADGTSGQVLSTSGAGVLSWATGGGSSSWSALTVPTADLSLAHAAYTTTFGWTATAALDPWTMNLTNNAGAATAQRFVNIVNALTSQTVDVNTEALLRLDNADTNVAGSTVVDDAILITNTGGITSGITDAIDASAAEIVNALNAGPNVILGTTAAIDFTNFDVSTAGLVTAGTYNGQTISSAANFTGTATVATSVSSPIFQGIAAAVTFGNASYGTTIAGSGLIVSPTAWTATPTISGLATMTLGFDSNAASTVAGLTVDTNGNLTVSNGTLSVTAPSTTGNAAAVIANSLTTGTALNVSSTSTGGGASGVSKVLNISRSGANDQLAHTSYGLYSAVTNTNVTSGTNIAGYFSASGATTANYGLIVAAGNVGIGTTGPASQLYIGNNVASWTNASNAQVTIEGVDNETTVKALSILDENANEYFFVSSVAGSSVGKTYFNGNVGIGTTGPAGKLDITDTSNTAASLSLTNNTATTIGVGIDTLGVLDLQSTSLTTGNFLNIELNALTSGKGLNLTSTSTGLTGDLTNITASGSNAAVTGSVLKVGLTGASAIGTALNVTSAGASGFALRVNDDGTYTDTTPFVVDYAGNVGVGDTSPASMLTVGSGDLFQVNSSGIIANIDGVAHTIDDVSGNLTLTSNGTSVMIADDLGVNGATSADITSTTTTATVFDTTVTSLSLGSAATTLNLGAGGALTRAINIGTGTGADTINIGTGITTADDIN
ncbi:MAG: phage integrase SAM-like domain-containing protein, partial [Patescibacteria group bacterium]